MSHDQLETTFKVITVDKEISKREISTSRALLKVSCVCSVVLDGKRSLDCELSIIGDRPTETKEELSAQISLRLTQFKRGKLVCVK